MKKTLIQLVKQETKPAIGCTEPVAVAYASAVAKKYLNDEIKHIDAKVSLNIFKNGKSVKIPFTDECGLDLAVAIGAIAGNPEDGYCVFKNVNNKALLDAKHMLNNNMVNVESICGHGDVYVDMEMKGKVNTSHIILANNHTHIQRIEVNNEVVFEDKKAEKSSQQMDILKNLTFKELREIAEEVNFEDIAFVLDGVKMNRHAAEQGLKLNKGLNFGSEFLKLEKEGKVSNDPFYKVRILTAAAADFRMGGGDCAVTTSGGSGNQGIGIIIPISVIADEINASDEKLSRALFFGHSINLFVKSYSGKLSSLCGCAIGSGIGSTAAITWLLGGNDRQIAGAVENMLANITGVLCDGAKGSCALKLSTSASEAVLSAYLACDNVIVPENTGIISKNVEGTIENIGILCKKALVNADEVIVNDIMNR
jgi:L-cysteine desulfidase